MNPLAQVLLLWATLALWVAFGWLFERGLHRGRGGVQ